jgi:hypothetical protein
MSPGDLVVCVNVGIIEGAFNLRLHLLNIGDVYTIEKSLIHAGRRGVRLIEFRMPRGEYLFASRFRPCRKTNIDDLIACVKEHSCDVVISVSSPEKRMARKAV